MIPNAQPRGKKIVHCHCVIFFADEGFGPELEKCQQATDSQTHTEEGLRRFETVAHLATCHLGRKQMFGIFHAIRDCNKKKKHSCGFKAEVLQVG